MITRRQRRVYDYIRGYLAEHGEPPTYREIGQEMGLSSPSSVHQHVETLVREGLICKRKHGARGIDLVEQEPTPDPPLEPEDAEALSRPITDQVFIAMHQAITRDKPLTYKRLQAVITAAIVETLA